MIRMFRQFVPKRKALLLFSETAILFTWLYGASWWLFKEAWLRGDLAVRHLLPNRTSFPPPWSSEFLGLAVSAFAVTVLCQVALSYNDLYDWKLSANRRELPQRMINAAGATLLTLAVLVLLFPSLFHFPGVIVTKVVPLGRTTRTFSQGTWKLIGLVLVGFLFLLAWRLALHFFFYKWELGERILVLGTGKQARDLVEEIEKRGDTGYQVVGMVGAPPKEKSPHNPVPYLGSPKNLPAITRENRVSRVIVALEDRRGSLPVKELLDCRLSGVIVEELESIYERVTGKISVTSLRPSYLIFGEGFRKTRMVLAVKRLLDVIFSLATLVLSSPILLASMVAIKLDSPGGIFFKQPRVGQDGETFWIYKLRSMKVDAEKHSGPVWAKKADDRITRVGRFLRATRIDEIPQMWNVLKGEMSFVGPRPERPFFVQELSLVIPYYAQRLTVKPGITGWAQINYPYGSSVEDAREKLQYDLYYIKNIGILFDITIILKTIRVVLSRKGV